MREKTCCFSGHRRLPLDQVHIIQQRLLYAVDFLYAQGVHCFLSGGALGFDQLAAALVLEKREAGWPVRLELVLPCRDQDKYWTPSQKEHYQQLIHQADAVVYVSDTYSQNCMKKRNLYMVEQSAYCICALLQRASGTGQTVEHALQKGVWILNAAAASVG